MGRSALVSRGDTSRFRSRAPKLPCRCASLRQRQAAHEVYSAKTIAAVERMAKADRRQATTIEQWDANDFAFNTEERQMATFDLRTGNSYAPRPSDYITKKSRLPCAPPETPHPVWTAFLERIAPDPELRAFLQRFIGYCLTGATTEHKFVFAYGTGANGKSTFINTIAAIFGDYATVADVGTFIAAATERHPTDVAKLHGYRLVVAQETEKGRRWDETKIKSMTGGDKMTARFMRCDFFDFVPKFKLWIVGNHKPRLDNVDEAMRRRMLLVPFTVQIPPEERDPDLPAKLKAEWPAILRWAIDGCLEWQRIGLRTAQDRHRGDRRVFRRPGHHQAVARRSHRRRRPVRLHPRQPIVRFVEAVVRRAQPKARN